jgi:hypothetical protein
MFSSKEIEKRGPGRDVGKIYHPVMNGSKKSRDAETRFSIGFLLSNGPRAGGRGRALMMKQRGSKRLGGRSSLIEMLSMSVPKT